MAKVLVACEFSGVVRDAFSAAGHDAMSCDLLPSEAEGKHYQGDVLECIEASYFDLIVAHPPCTAIAVSGNRWYAGTYEREAAIEWTVALWELMIKHATHVALENPIGALSGAWQPPTQYVQPWMFGHDEAKKTGLWLHKLPVLKATHHKPKKIRKRMWLMADSKGRSKRRSVFYTGVANAMVEQWGPYLTNLH